MAKRKSFADAAAKAQDNPALAFISRESIEAVDGAEKKDDAGDAAPIEGDAGTPPEGYRANPLYLEKKSQRVQAILQPSLWRKAKAASEEEGISFNELVHRALRAYLDGRDGQSR